MNGIFLFIIVVVIAIYCMNKSGFTSVDQSPGVQQTDVYHLDTRFNYPTVPPVNPMAYKTIIRTSVPVEHGLFSTQENIKNGYILDQNGQNGLDSTNQLDYSGGSTKLLKIPLQMNEPYNEQLRTQEVLITPYNRIKYDTC